MREYERLGGNNTPTIIVRVSAAANRDLKQEVAVGRFQGDLPPQCDHGHRALSSGSPLRFAAFCRKLLEILWGGAETQSQKTLTRAVRCILAHPWPGILRELRNSIEPPVIPASGTEIGLRDLLQGIRIQDALFHRAVSIASGHGVGVTITPEKIERERIRRIIETIPTIQQAARVLGIDAATIYRKRPKHGDQAALAKSLSRE